MSTESQESFLIKSPPAASVGWALLVFGLWIAIVFIFNAIARLAFGAGSASTWHWSSLLASLIFVLVVVPVAKLFGPQVYSVYLSDIGLTIDSPRPSLFPALIFAVVLVMGVLLELRGNVSDLLRYHNAGASYILLSSLQPAISEEIVIRGVMYGRIRKFVSPILTIGITAVMFGLLHAGQGPMRIFQTTIVGAAFGTLRWRTGTVWLAVLAHFLINIGLPVPVWSAWLGAIATSLMVFLYTSRTGNSPDTT